MENQVTSIEQSRRLLELGVPAEKASMVWCQKVLSFADGIDYEAANKAGAELIPAFTVADLLGIIPFMVDIKGMNMYLSFDSSKSYGPMHFTYESLIHAKVFSFIDYENDSLVTSACSCIEWLSDNGINIKL